MITAFDDEVTRFAHADENVIVIGADDGRYHSLFQGQLKKQYINVGIAECNAVGMAAGLAACGRIPFVTAGGTFLAHRANEFIRNDVCQQKRNVKIVALGAGLALNALGNTQHMTEDVTALRAFPNLTIISAASPTEAKLIAAAAYREKGPLYIRLGRHEGIDIYDENSLNFRVGKGQVVVKGEDICIITTGTIISDVMAVLPQLREAGFCPEIINMHTIKPIDEELILSEAENIKKILVVEEHSVLGGLSGAVAEVLINNGRKVKFSQIGMQDRFATGYGSYRDIKETNGFSRKQIFDKCVEITRG